MSAWVDNEDWQSQPPLPETNWRREQKPTTYMEAALLLDSP